MLSRDPNQISRIFMVIGTVLLVWGMQKLNAVGNPDEADIQARVDSAYQMEIKRMEQTALKRLSERKEELASMSEEERTLALLQATGPFELTPEQEAKHRKAIRRDITASIEHKRKKAFALIFAGGALLFLMLSPIFSQWLTDKVLDRKKQ